MVSTLPAEYRMEHKHLTNIILIITLATSSLGQSPTQPTTQPTTQPSTAQSATTQHPLQCPSACVCQQNQPAYHVTCANQSKCQESQPTHHVTCANQSLSSIPEALPDNITTLDLNTNSLTSWNTEVFHRFRHLQELTVSYNLLTVFNISNQSLNSLRILDISHNQLTSFNFEALNSMIYLQTLDLSYNSLSSVDSAIFSGFIYLEKLDLRHNKINTISQDAFEGMSQLKYLCLGYNYISEIPHALLKDTHSLVISDFSHNLLTNFDDNNIFSESFNLIDLDLSYNDLSTVTIHVLNGLESLNLGWNRIAYLDGNMFTQLLNITALTLDGNPLASITSPVFRNLRHLQWLSLSHMGNLSHLNPRAFEGLENVDELIMNNNPKLSFIHNDLFLPLHNLTTIDLSNNSLFTIYNNTFNIDGGKLSTVNLHGNTFNCDCGIAWLATEIQTNSSIFLNADTLVCTNDSANHTISKLTDIDIKSLTCSNVTIANYSSDSAFQIGTSVVITCQAYSDPSPEIVWVTPRSRVLSYYQTFSTPVRNISIAEALDEAGINTMSEDHPSYYSESETRPDRIQILADGSLYIDFIMRSDAGHYTCIAKNPQHSSQVVVSITLDYEVMNNIQVWSLIVGFSCAGSFFLLNLTYSLTLAAIRRCISQRRRERIRHMIETIDHYKSSQLSRIKENYSLQVGKIRDQYHYQLGRLRESHTNQVRRMGRMREGASQRVDRLKENYNNQLSRLKEYSSSQLEQLREKYNSQVDRIKDYGNVKLERIHEKYKLKQQHVIKLFDMMNLDKCRSAFESECVRTESMILQSEVFTHEVPLHSPIDSVSISDSEYMTATSTESSKYSSQRNINQNPNDDSELSPMNPYIPDDCAVDMELALEIDKGAIADPLTDPFPKTFPSKSKSSKTPLTSDSKFDNRAQSPDFMLDLDDAPSPDFRLELDDLDGLDFNTEVKDYDTTPSTSGHTVSDSVTEVPFPPGKRHRQGKRHHKPQNKKTRKAQRHRYCLDVLNSDETQELYQKPCDNKREKNSLQQVYKVDQSTCTDSSASCSSKSLDDPRNKRSASKKSTSKDRPLSLSNVKRCNVSENDNSTTANSEQAESMVQITPAGRVLGKAHSLVDIQKETIGESVV